jgi:hypothetical protein
LNFDVYRLFIVNVDETVIFYFEVLFDGTEILSFTGYGSNCVTRFLSDVFDTSIISLAPNENIRHIYHYFPTTSS